MDILIYLFFITILTLHILGLYHIITRNMKFSAKLLLFLVTLVVTPIGVVLGIRHIVNV